MYAARSVRTLLIALPILVLTACQDSPVTMPPEGPADAAVPAAPAAHQALASLFDRVSPEVMALPQTVFAARDEEAGQLVFGVEHPGVATAVRNVMERRGISASAYRVEVTEPIRFMNGTLRDEPTLRDAYRPTMGGVQLHWSQYVCTLGFSVDHAGGRSFITNSHCTDKQGENGGTIYYQPSSSVASDPIGVEADDPEYVRGLPDSDCSHNRRCRYSDAARVLYSAGVESLGHIAKTTGVNNGSLDVDGSFDITAQDDVNTTFSGTLHKVGRTTGWTSGNVTDSCVTVNVFGSNIQLLCQTMVRRSGTRIVQGGDSGSPVFQHDETDKATLVGILWGGSSSGDRFVFSPLKNIQDELGALDATTDATSEPPVVEDPGSITGTVKDAEAGTAIAGATVSVDGSTELSAVTDEFGEYTIPEVPAGTHAVTASKEDYVSQTETGVEVASGAATTLNFALDPEPEDEDPAPDPDPEQGTVTVSAVEYSTTGGRTSDRHLHVTVTLVTPVDDGTAPVSGASVTIELAHGGTLYGTATGTTGSDGALRFSFNNAPTGAYTTLVTNVSAGGFTWDEETPENSFAKP